MVTLVLTCGSVLLPGTATAAPTWPSTTACGSPLSPADMNRIAALSEVGTPADTVDAWPALTDHVRRLEEINAILVAHRDRRGLFAVGLAATERAAVLPLESAAGGLQNPLWARRLSLALLDRFLDAVHAEFTGTPVAPHWRRYFDVAAQCDVSGTRAAMLGYNAHITVDLAYAVADARTNRGNSDDYFRLVDSIAAHGDSIVTATKREYGVDLGPTFRFYFFGEGLDRVVGAGRATGPMLRAADVGYNVLTFENGLALQNPTTRPAAIAAIDALWSTGDAAIKAADDLGITALK